MPSLAEAGPAGGSTAPKEFPKSLPLMSRSLPAEDLRLVKGDDGYTRLTFSVASETPVPRWYGDEILSHADGAIREDRLKRGAVMYLFNHNPADPVGVVEGYRVMNKRLFVDVKFFKTNRSEEVAAMVDGGMRNVSLMYRIHVVEEDVKKQRYTITDWEPYEVSAEPIPADHTVGVGRAQEAGEQFEVRMLRASPDVSETTATRVTAPEVVTPAQPAKIGDRSMPELNEAAAGSSADRSNAAAAVRVEAGQQQEHPSAVEMEKSRRRAIENLCKANKLEERYQDHWIRSGLSLEEVSNDILSILEERGRTNPQSVTKLGMSTSEAQQFSLRRAIHAIVEKDWSKAGYELECSRSVAQKLGRVNEPHKFFVPYEVLERQVPVQKRDASVGTPSAGGYLVTTENQGFIEILRNRSVAFRMGARRLSGLQGNVTVPRQSAAGTGYWLTTETSTPTESQPTFTQMALSPKTVAAYTEVSRLLMLQSSPAAEGIVTDDLAQVVALAADLSVLSGSGASGQPTGLTTVSGTGSVTGTSLAYAGILEFQTDVATSNVVPARGGYVTTPAVAGLLMARSRFANTDTPLWVGNLWDGQMAGFPAMSSNQIGAATAIFGDWQEVVVGEWGVLEVEVNPYANFQAGIIGVRAMYSLDVGIRRPFAFSIATSIT
jgi:HK97 family phage major capsid protein